jgi:hypothetical protein
MFAVAPEPEVNPRRITAEFDELVEVKVAVVPEVPGVPPQAFSATGPWPPLGERYANSKSMVPLPLFTTDPAMTNAPAFIWVVSTVVLAPRIWMAPPAE